jgi:hypothetical protein
MVIAFDQSFRKPVLNVSLANFGKKKSKELAPHHRRVFGLHLATLLYVSWLYETTQHGEPHNRPLRYKPPSSNDNRVSTHLQAE